MGINLVIAVTNGAWYRPYASVHLAEQISALVTLVLGLARTDPGARPLPHQAVLLAKMLSCHQISIGVAGGKRAGTAP